MGHIGLPLRGPLFIFLIPFACLLSLTRCELTGVSIRGDQDDVVYVKRSDNDTCGGVLHIKNNNTFEVTVNVYDGYNSQDLTVPAEDTEDVQLNSSFIQGSKDRFHYSPPFSFHIGHLYNIRSNSQLDF
ncbi:hypothetical protein Btru_073504 [Bulinus truncatus]|nr:hypothetical protein Btru_073504 [Bulinus truncatus]